MQDLSTPQQLYEYTDTQTFRAVDYGMAGCCNLNRFQGETNVCRKTDGPFLGSRICWVCLLEQGCVKGVDVDVDVVDVKEARVFGCCD